MKRVIILNSPLYEEINSKNKEDYLPPLGLGIIFSAIEKKFRVSFVDSIAENLSVDLVIALLEKEKPDFVCINIFTTNYNLVKQIVEKTPIRLNWIIGGISTKSLHTEIFNWITENQIDIVYGDGEGIVESIINSTISQEPKAFKDKRRFFIVDQHSAYYVKTISNEQLNRSIFKSEPQLNIYDEYEVCIYTSRGCPYHCAYCVASHLRNTELGSIRCKDVNSIVSELETIHARYPEVISIRVLDDLFLSNRTSFENAVSIFNRFNFSWRAMCHIKSVNNIDDKMLLRLSKSGCKELFIGIESGSPDILTKIHKTSDVDMIERSVKRILGAGIRVKGYFICGLPGETEEDLERTLKLAIALKKHSNGEGIFRNSTFQFRPYYGTDLYDQIVFDSGIEYNSILLNTKDSVELNTKVRNKSFNFESGNYSSVSRDILLSYIMRMNLLNE